ncbi:putative FBD-associated F-box protein At5g56820 [Lotus japonicus]|uniref:putative FBD-associated F-box protein At5g56820 n=1 Tax=Lotus japonicus TaxID=34305 RepID=UPI002583ACD7|nr:putative FBD-associated F-box protein At5g56820 [Lotus japonicus]
MVDRISMLPDELLCHILSFLQTIQAVKTRLLSKRWRNIWTSVPVLDYDHQSYYLRNNKPNSCFERFVYATILARDFYQPIRSFTLKYGVPDSYLSNVHVNVWVNIVFKIGIQNIDLDLYPRKNRISLDILSSKTLVVLKLQGLNVNVSTSLELSSLKSLHLEEVKFVQPKYLIELLYGCPMLEDLKARCLDYDLKGYYSKEEFKFKSLPKLVRADLHFAGMDDTNILLKSICNVEFLRIQQFRFVDEVPEFPHLRHLSLHLDNRRLHWWVFLMLKNCPKLQSLKLDLNESFESEDVLPYPHLVVPECLTSHFTQCYLKYCPGTEGGLQFAKYIMQNSTSLKSMKVHCVSHNLLAKLEVQKELALCSRKSASCELSFV